MSITLMAQAWANGPDDRSELLVLLALADFANDKGECWPSMITIGDKARMSDRGARKVVRKLEEQGYIRCIKNGGRGGSNHYIVCPIINPEHSSAPAINPEQSDTKPGTPVPQTRNPGSDKPSRTIKNLTRKREVFSSDDFWKDSIRRAKPGAAAHVSPSQAREWIVAGDLTEDECRKAGVL